MTGSELASALRATAELVERLSKVNGLDLEVLPGANLVVISSSAERMRKLRTYREHNAHRKRTQGVTEREQNANIADSSLSSNPDLDPSSVPDPDSVVPDSSSENLSGCSGKKRAARATKARKAKWTRVPADWEPKPEHYELAANRNLTFEDELANFRDHEFKDPRTDADASFRKWLRQPWKGGPKNGTTSRQSAIQQWLDDETGETP